MTTQTQHQINGVSVDQLMETIYAIEENPSLANIQFRAQTQWTGGARCRTEIQGFHGAGQEDASRTEPFVVESDLEEFFILS